MGDSGKYAIHQGVSLGIDQNEIKASLILRKPSNGNSTPSDQAFITLTCYIDTSKLGTLNDTTDKVYEILQEWIGDFKIYR